MPNLSVRLSDDQDRFIEDGIASGRFRDASDAIGEGLRLLEQRDHEEQAKLHWLRDAAKEGFDQLDRGEGIQFESTEDFDAYIDQIGIEVSSEIASERERE